MGRIKERGAQGAPVSKFPCQGIKISHTNETVHESLTDRCNLPFRPPLQQELLKSLIRIIFLCFF